MSPLLLTSAIPVRSSVDTGRRSAVTQSGSVVLVTEVQEIVLQVETDIPGSMDLSSDQSTDRTQLPPITVTPPTPADPERRFPLLKRSSTDHDSSTGKKVHQMFKNRVHKGQEKISTISRKIGHGVVRNGNLKRTNSAPGKGSFG